MLHLSIACLFIFTNVKDLSSTIDIMQGFRIKLELNTIKIHYCYLTPILKKKILGVPVATLGIALPGCSLGKKKVKEVRRRPFATLERHY